MSPWLLAQSTRRGRSVSKHVRRDRSPNAGLAAQAGIGHFGRFLRAGVLLGTFSAPPRRPKPGPRQGVLLIAGLTTPRAAVSHVPAKELCSREDQNPSQVPDLPGHLCMWKLI